MARAKEFDPDTALDAALMLFWERGYEATSMADLVERLGVARASLYATFGGKHALYLAALDRYRGLTDPVVLAELSRPGPVLPAVRALVRRYAAEAAGPDAGRGCFVVNTAVELAPHDEAATRRVQASWDHLEAVLAAALTRAAAQDELPGRDPVALARCLLVFLQGLRVAGRAATEPERLADAVDQILTLLSFGNDRS
ncbi:TetR/AcrR family transcriptional regulator [Cryptosporangium phraense]|uniref:Helix-turn-helix transcriptional regulator n=1 Tax=Cryptosporangium phraense TaxID=2593070 RepID=A0A545ARM3_9ACTN|nr:TetR/AcrR family transcriptional regulator [Cryptosporangium phraense]TQS43979.1 helix-turn-helix transcriptional regulator [Cryptosporangium phraense]